MERKLKQITGIDQISGKMGKVRNGNKGRVDALANSRFMHSGIVRYRFGAPD